MTIDKNRQVFVRMGYIDMRKQITGLARIVQDYDSQGPFSGSYYIFMGKTRRVMKILYWETTGFCLWQKRLEDDSFPWPKDDEAISEITRDQVLLLLRGLDIWREHQEKRYASVG